MRITSECQLSLRWLSIPKNQEQRREVKRREELGRSWDSEPRPLPFLGTPSARRPHPMQEMVREPPGLQNQRLWLQIHGYSPDGVAETGGWGRAFSGGDPIDIVRLQKREGGGGVPQQRRATMTWATRLGIGSGKMLIDSNPAALPSSLDALEGRPKLRVGDVYEQRICIRDLPERPHRLHKPSPRGYVLACDWISLYRRRGNRVAKAPTKVRTAY